MPFYIQRQDKSVGVPTETVDEAVSRPEAVKLFKVYRDGDHGAIYYVSTVPTKGWVNK